MNVAPNPPPARGAAIRCDLYCLKCGYNLRGLSGDPVRCPECGNFNPRYDAELPAALISAQLHRMETAPAIGVGLMLLFVVLGVLAGAMADLSFRNAGFQDALQALGGFSVFLAAIAALWIGCMFHFRGSCQKKPEWLRAWLVYQGWGLLLLCSVAGPVAILLGLIFWISSRSPHDPLPAWQQFGMMVLPLAALLSGTICGARYICPRVTGAIRPLQREVAVHIARETLRRRQMHRSNWF